MATFCPLCIKKSCFILNSFTMFSLFTIGCTHSNTNNYSRITKCKPKMFFSSIPIAMNVSLLYYLLYLPLASFTDVALLLYDCNIITGSIVVYIGNLVSVNYRLEAHRKLNYIWNKNMKYSFGKSHTLQKSIDTSVFFVVIIECFLAIIYFATFSNRPDCFRSLTWSNLVYNYFSGLIDIYSDIIIFKFALNECYNDIREAMCSKSLNAQVNLAKELKSCTIFYKLVVETLTLAHVYHCPVIFACSFFTPITMILSVYALVLCPKEDVLMICILMVMIVASIVYIWGGAFLVQTLLKEVRIFYNMLIL